MRSAVFMRLLLLALLAVGSRGARRSKLLGRLLNLEDANDFRDNEEDHSIRKAAKESVEDSEEGFSSVELIGLRSLIKTAGQAAGSWNDEKEQKVGHFLQSLFAMLDADGDGHVTPGELKSGCFVAFAMLYAKGGPKLPRAICNMAVGICGNSAYDTFQLISLERLAKVAFLFQDENDDGKITTKELANTQFVASVYLSRDSERFGGLAPEEMCERAVESATVAGYEEIFRRMDANENGVISAKEYKADVFADVE